MNYIEHQSCFLDPQFTKKQKTYQDKITSWASTRASLSEMQQDVFKEQHQLKIALMLEKHKLEMKMMNEKHIIEIEKLKLQKEILQIQKNYKFLNIGYSCCHY